MCSDGVGYPHTIRTRQPAPELRKRNSDQQALSGGRRIQNAALTDKVIILSVNP